MSELDILEKLTTIDESLKRLIDLHEKEVALTKENNYLLKDSAQREYLKRQRKAY